MRVGTDAAPAGPTYGRTIGKDGNPISATAGISGNRDAAAAAQPAGKASPSKRELLALAAVLAATTLTAAGAIAGLSRTAPPATVSTPTVSQIVGPAPAPPPRVEPGD